MSKAVLCVCEQWLAGGLLQRLCKLYRQTLLFTPSKCDLKWLREDRKKPELFSDIDQKGGRYSAEITIF